MIGRYVWVKPKRMDTEEFVSTREAANMLNISLSTVQRYVDQGVLGGITNPITGRRDVYRQSVLDLMDKYGMTAN